MNYRELQELTEQAERLCLQISDATVCQRASLPALMGTDSLEAAYMLADMGGIIVETGEYYLIWRNKNEI